MVIFALVMGGAIAGLLGAILALPIAATMRDLYIYAFRRAGGMSSEEAATGDARSTPESGPASLEEPDDQPAEPPIDQPAASPADRRTAGDHAPEPGT